jgi:long-chain acyl-CoA synthetase
MSDETTLHALLKSNVLTAANLPAYRWFKEDGTLDCINWHRYYEQCGMVAKSMLAFGLSRFDKICILSETCYQWQQTLCGAGFLGVATAGVYPSNLAEDCQYVINHSDAVLLFVQNQQQLQKILKIRKNLSNIHKVILFEGNTESNDSWIITYKAFLREGENLANDILATAIKQVAPQDPLLLIYTSGTTGVPKGVVLSHENPMKTIRIAKKFVITKKNDETLLFLPMAHVLAHACIVMAAATKTPLTFSRGINFLKDDLNTVRPHWFFAVPRIFEKLHDKIHSDAHSKSWLTSQIFDFAVNIGLQRSRYQLKNKWTPLWLFAPYRIADRIVFKKIKKALGGRLRWVVSGGAPLNPEIAKFFHAMDILILEGYGLTETTSFSFFNAHNAYRFGTVGKLGEGLECRIAEDGEILLRGVNIMQGYYKMPVETSQAIDVDGWFYTGDLGMIDTDGYLTITGRKKDLIITSGGKNIAPSRIEAFLMDSRYIEQACLIGDQRKYLTALITLNRENVIGFIKNKYPDTDYEKLEQNDMVHALIESEIAVANKNLASYESIKRFRIVPEFKVENATMTPTMKLKRVQIMQKHNDVIDDMYREEK